MYHVKRRTGIQSCCKKHQNSQPPEGVFVDISSYSTILETFATILKGTGSQMRYCNISWRRLMRALPSGNFNLRGGPNFKPDQASSVFPSSSVILISNAPLLTVSDAGFICESMSEAARLEEAMRVMASPARFLNTCQDLQWIMVTCKASHFSMHFLELKIYFFSP